MHCLATELLKKWNNETKKGAKRAKLFQCVIDEFVIVLENRNRYLVCILVSTILCALGGPFPCHLK